MKTAVFQCETHPEMYQALSEYAGVRIWGADRGFGPGAAMGLFSEAGNLQAAVIYHNNDDWAGIIEYSGASDNPRWLTRDVMFAIFDYPFNRLGKNAVFTRIGIENAKLGRIYKWYGFTEHEVPHMRGPGKSEFVYVLTKEAWMNNGKHKGKHHV